MASLLCFSFDWSIFFRKKGWDSAVSFEKRYFFKHAVNRNCKHADKYLVNYFLGMTVLLTLLVELTAKLSGNAELNPGPYEIMRSVQGSFYQGNVVLFGETTGKKCVCNVLLSICWFVSAIYVIGSLSI